MQIDQFFFNFLKSVNTYLAIYVNAMLKSKVTFFFYNL